MIKKILLFLFSLLLSIVIDVFFLNDFLRPQIQSIYIWSTDSKIKFYGKNLHFFNNEIY